MQEMAEVEEVEIQIRYARKRKSETYRAMPNRQISCNIVERACVEALKLPWTRADHGITYDFSDHASPPLGRCELDWGWEEGSATLTDTFIVVEEVKRTPCSVILGPTVSRLPFVPPFGHDVYTFAMAIRSKGTVRSHTIH
jgi:hypothetical protein